MSCTSTEHHSDQRVLLFLLAQHNIKNEDGRSKRSKTSLKSYLSMIKKCFRLVHSVDIEADIPQILGRECSCFYYTGCASSYSLSRSRICGMPPSKSIRCTSLKYFLIIEKLDLNDVLLCLHLPSSFFNVMLVQLKNFPKCS